MFTVVFILILAINIGLYLMGAGSDGKGRGDIVRKASKPMWNIDGAMMMGDFDTNGNPYGVTKSPFDRF